MGLRRVGQVTVPTSPSVSPSHSQPRPVSSATCDRSGISSLSIVQSVEREVKLTTRAGVAVVVLVPPLHLCAPAPVTVTAADGGSLVSEGGDEPVISVFVHFFTSNSTAGAACDALRVNCTLVSRPVPLTRGAQGNTLIGYFTPDSSSFHYAVGVEVCVCA